VEIEIRLTRLEEISTVCEVHREAFNGREQEPRLVELLHAAGKTPVSLVALRDLPCTFRNSPPIRWGPSSYW
jgi:predicted N-acetyltransferase YhbS